MKRLEKRLFYYLLNRWANEKLMLLMTSNGLVCITKDFKLRVKIAKL